MKSMSWLLYENASSVLRECQACGFSTRSPSIYRRHSRHCAGCSSPVQTSQESNGSIPALDFPNISCKLSADFPDDHLELPADVDCKPSVDFPSITRESSVSYSEPPTCGKLAVVDAGDQVDSRSDKADVVVKDVSEGLEEGGTGTALRTSSAKVEPLTSEFLLNSPQSSSTSTPADNNLQMVPVNSRSLLCCVASRPVVDNVSTTVPVKIESDVDLPGEDLVDEDFNKSDDIPSLKCDASDSVKKVTALSRVDTSDVLHPLDTSNSVDHGSRLVDSREVIGNIKTETDSLAETNTVTTTDESCMEPAGEEMQAASTKSPRSRKGSSPSKQRRCKHCKCLLSSRLDRRTHMQTEHPDKIPVFRCSDCNYCSVEHKNYERHLLRHLLAGPFRCDKCSFSSTSQSSIKRHVTLQHISQSSTAADTATSLDVPPEDVPPEIAVTSSTVSEVQLTASSPAVSRIEAENSVSEIFSSPPDLTSGAGLPPDSARCEKLNSEDEAVSNEHCCGSGDEGESSERKADVSSKEDVTPDSSKDASQSVIEVEVKNYPGEDGGDEEIWWTCLACGARYNERAKVRRHVKCKHHVPLTECRLNDLRLRTTPPAPSTSTSSSTVNSLLQKVQEAQSLVKTEAAATVGQLSATSEQKPITTRSDESLVSSRVKLQAKSFVKIAPKPLQLDSNNCQIFAAPAAVVNPKRQVVLPKRNWRQMSLSLQTANSVPESVSEASDAGVCSADSELKRHLTGNTADDKKLSSHVVVQQVGGKEPEESVGLCLLPVTDEVPKKKRRLILRAKANKMVLEANKTVLEPCSAVTNESCDSVKDAKSNPAGTDVLPTEHANNVEMNEHSSKIEDTTSGEPVEKASESNNELKKTKTKRQFGLKRTSPLKCAHCQFTSYRLQDLRRHLLEHTGDRVYECGICYRTFRNKIGLYLHEQRKHKADLVPPSDTSQLDDNSNDQSSVKTEQIAQSTMDTDQTAAETQRVDSSADKTKLKKKRKRIRNVSLGSGLKQELDEHSASKVEKLADNEEGTDECVSAETDDKGHEKKERPTNKRCTETVEMTQSTDKSDHFKIVIRRQSSIGEEILQTIAGVNNGMICRYCGYIAKIPMQLTQHLKIHTGERDYWCTIGDCTYGTIWRCDMKRHFCKFHPDEVERRGGSYYELLQRCYRPGKPKDKTGSSLPAESCSSSTVSVLKMSKRQRRRLLKLQTREQSRLPEKEGSPENKSEEEASFIVNTSDVTGTAKECLSAAESEAQKHNLKTRSVERFRPYKCSECGRRSNWRWDLKKHVEGMHKNAVIIKLSDDVARSTFADIYTSHGGRNGIRFPRRHSLSELSLSRGSKGEIQPNSGDNSQTEESGADQDGKKPVSELEKTFSSAPGPVKSIGMIDLLRLKRFQCSGCPYRSNHRGDLGRHIRMRHGRGNCTISVLAADVAAATLHAYRLQWNRKKGRLPKTDPLHLPQTGKTDGGKTLQKLHRSGRSAAETDDKVSEDAEKHSSVAEPVSEASSRKQQHYKDFWYLEGADDETKCCDMCPFKTDRTGLLELHKLRHRAPAPGSSSSRVTFSCPHCPYFVRTSRQLERHMALHEDAVQPQPESALNSTGVLHISHSAKHRYVCDKCPFVSMVRSEFWLHRRHHFVPRVAVPYCCDLCPFWVSDRRTLTEHAVLHTQSYYPRLSVPVVSRCRPASADSSGDVTGGIVTALNNCHGEVAAEVVQDVQSEKNLGIDDDEMVVGSCPQLDAVDHRVATVSEAETEALDCCPLLEPESEQSSFEPLSLGESMTCPTLFAEVLTPSSGPAADLMTSLKDDGTAAVHDGIPARDCTGSTDLKTAIVSTVSAETVVSVLPPGELVVNTVTSDGDDVLPSDNSDASDDRISASSDTDLKTQELDCQRLGASPTYCAESLILTPSSNAAESLVTPGSEDVLLNDNKSDVSGGDRMVPTVCCESEQLQQKANDSSSTASESSIDAVNSETGVLQVEVLPKKYSNDDVSDQTGSTNVSCHQTSDVLTATVSDSTQAPDAGGRHDGDVLPESNIDTSDGGKPTTDISETGEVKVSDHEIRDGSSVGGNSGKVVGSRDDGRCACTLQCPYCFFSIASVRLLRQHIMFHVAMSDAIFTPVFQSELDTVEDGRMDDMRCAHVIQLCSRFRHVADLGNPNNVAMSETCLENRDVVSSLGNTDQMTELQDKTVFLSHLSLCVSDNVSDM